MRVHFLRRPVTLAAVGLGLVMLVMGAAKLANPEFARAEFEHWGYPGSFGIVVGVLEVAGAVLVVASRTRFLGSGLLAGVLIGAVFTHLRVPEVGLLPLAIPLLTIAIFVAWRTRPHASGGEEAPVAPAR